MNESEQKVDENSNADQPSVSVCDEKQPRGWILVQQQKKLPEKMNISYTIGRIVDTFTNQGFKMRVINSRDIDIYLTNYERKSILVNGVITKLPDFVLSRTGANTSFSTLAIYRHLERLGMLYLNEN